MLTHKFYFKKNKNGFRSRIIYYSLLKLMFLENLKLTVNSARAAMKNRGNTEIETAD